MGTQNYNNSLNNINKTVSIWDCVTIANCKDIATFGANWTELFESSYTRPEEKNSLVERLLKQNGLLN